MTNEHIHKRQPTEKGAHHHEHSDKKVHFVVPRRLDHARKTVHLPEVDVTENDRAPHHRQGVWRVQDPEGQIEVSKPQMKLKSAITKGRHDIMLLRMLREPSARTQPQQAFCTQEIA